MLKSDKHTRCCVARARSAAALSGEWSDVVAAYGKEPLPALRRVLVVEFRDEVYASLQTLLHDAGISVSRADSSSIVAGLVSRLVPDLILINVEMPDESGWVISSKLRLQRQTQPVWLYLAQAPPFVSHWKKFSGAEEVIDYEGTLGRLVEEVGRRIGCHQTTPY